LIFRKNANEGQPLPSQPIADASFVALEQGFKTVEPSVGVFDDWAAAVKFRVEKGVVVAQPVVFAAVTGDVGFDLMLGAFLSKGGGIEGFVSVEKTSLPREYPPLRCRRRFS
jgi:hypothetical protein